MAHTLSPAVLVVFFSFVCHFLSPSFFLLFFYTYIYFSPGPTFIGEVCTVLQTYFWLLGKYFYFYFFFHGFYGFLFSHFLWIFVFVFRSGTRGATWTGPRGGR